MSRDNDCGYPLVDMLKKNVQASVQLGRTVQNPSAGKHGFMSPPVDGFFDGTIVILKK